MAFLKRAAKKKGSKYIFDVIVHTLTNLSFSTSTSLSVKWQRSRRHGETQAGFTAQDKVVWEETLEVPATMYRSGDAPFFDKKYLELTVQEIREKKTPKAMGMLKLNLAQFAGLDSSKETVVLPLESGTFKGGLLKVSITAHLKHKGTLGDAGSRSMCSDTSSITDGLSNEDADSDKEDISVEKLSIKVNSSEKKEVEREPDDDDDDDDWPQIRRDSKNSRIEDARPAVTRAAAAQQSLPSPSRLTVDSSPPVSAKSQQKTIVDTAKSPVREIAIKSSPSTTAPSKKEAPLPDPIEKPKHKSTRKKASEAKRVEIEKVEAEEEDTDVLVSVSNGNGDVHNGNGDSNALSSSPVSRVPADTSAPNSKSNALIETTSKVIALRGALDMVARQEKEVQQLKQQMISLSMQLDESYVIENVIYAIEANVFLDKHGQPQVCSSAWIIFRCLTQWGVLNCAAYEPEATLSRIIFALTASSKRSVGDLDIQHYLLSNLVTLQQFIRSAITKETVKDPVVAKFREDLEAVTKEHFARMLRRQYERIDPLMQTALAEQLEAIKSKRSCMDECENYYIDQATSFLQEVIASLRRGFLYLPLARCYLKQCMYHIDAMLLNQLIENRETCNFSCALRMKHMASRFGNWSRGIVGSWLFADHEAVYDLELNCPKTRQAGDLLMIDKGVLADRKTRASICPDLTPVQIRALLDSYSADELASDPVPAAILLSLDREIEQLKEKPEARLDPEFVPELPSVPAVDPTYIIGDKRSVPANLRSKPRFKFLLEK